MEIALKLESREFAPAEVQSTVIYALHTEMEQARLRRDYYNSFCKTFEEAHHFSSDEFLVRFERGELGDDAYRVDFIMPNAEDRS